MKGNSFFTPQTWHIWNYKFVITLFIIKWNLKIVCNNLNDCQTWSKITNCTNSHFSTYEQVFWTKQKKYPTNKLYQRKKKVIEWEKNIYKYWIDYSQMAPKNDGFRVIALRLLNGEKNFNFQTISFYIQN